MVELVAVFALVSVASLGVGAFILVNAMRVYAPMLKANADIAERGAQYQTTLQMHVDRRVEIVNQEIKKAKRYMTTPLAEGPAEPEPPDDEDILEQRMAEERERRERIAAEFNSHPDGVVVE